MKHINRCLILLVVLNMLLACDKQDGFEGKSSSHTVSIMFSSLPSESAIIPEQAGDFNTLAFRHTGEPADKSVKWIPVEASWNKMQGDGYKMTCQLETGAYHFSLSKGMKVVASEEKGNAGSRCFWVEDSEPRKLGEYLVWHPKGDDGNLKECKAELFLNGTDMQEEKDIQSAQKFGVELSHIQARLDLLIAYKGTEAVKGAETVSPLARIKEMTIELRGLNACYRLTGEEVSGEKKATFCQTLGENDFSEFKLEDYKKEFQSSAELPDILQQVKSKPARIKKWLFFPTNQVEGTLHVTYNNGHKQSLTVSDINLVENKATVIVVWVSKEHLLLEPEGILGGRLSESTPSEEGGFWN